jgi:hypothetical protein
MNDKVSRIALVLLGLGLSALALKAIVKEKEPDRSAEVAGLQPGAAGGAGGSGTPGAANPGPAGGDASGTAQEDAGDGTFDPLAGRSALRDTAGAGGGTPQEVEPVPVMPRRDVGPPLEDGTPVEATLRRVEGTVTRYRVTNAVAQRDRSTGASTGQRWTFEVTTKVTGIADDGTARVRMQVDALRLQVLAADGLNVDFDSRDPDDALLNDPRRAMSVKPLLAIIGVPVEFVLGKHGGCTDIEGLDAWHEAWVEAVEALDPGSSRKAVPPYTRDTVLHEWSEVLFPPILGGTLTVGEPRDVQILRDTLQDAYVEFRGPLEATHDDGEVFRVRLLTKAEMMPRQGPARSPQEAAVAGVRVLSSADSYDAAWRFEREPGRLVDAEIDTEYQIHVSWHVGKDGEGEDSYQRVFLDVERMTRVELLPGE